MTFLQFMLEAVLNFLKMLCLANKYFLNFNLLRCEKYLPITIVAL